MDLIELGKITESEYDTEHLCSENQYPNQDRLVHCIKADEIIQNNWQMHNIHLAVLKEVEMGEAEFVGEITGHSMLLINFCPFCGKELSAN